MSEINAIRFAEPWQVSCVKIPMPEMQLFLRFLTGNSGLWLLFVKKSFDK